MIFYHGDFIISIKAKTIKIAVCSDFSSGIQKKIIQKVIS